MKRRSRQARGPGRYDRTLTPATRRAEQSARLVQAAAEMFAARGLAGASVQAIVRRAGMSRRTFYEHFVDLDDAFVHVYEAAASRIFTHVEERSRAHTDPASRLQAGVLGFLSLAAENADLARVLYGEIRAAGPRHAARHRATQARFMALINEEVTEAYAKGWIRRRPTELTVFALVSGIEAVTLRFLERGEENRIADAAPELVELVVRAFR